MKQTLLWTVLPNGIDRSALIPMGRCSVHVGVRLDSDGGVAGFSDFEMSEWPSKRFEFGLQMTGPDGVQRELELRQVLAAGVAAAPDADLWRRLFPPDLAVRPRSVSTLHNQNIRSYSAENLRNIVRDVYADVAASYPTAPPTIEALYEGQEGTTSVLDLAMLRVDDDHETILDERGNRRDTLDTALTNGRWPNALPPGSIGTLPGGKALPYLPVDDAFALQLNIVQHEAFLEPRNGIKTVKKNEPNPFATAVATPEFDFHQALSMVGNHPAILRRLGLVKDFEFDLAAVPWLGDGRTACSVRLAIAEVPFDQETVFRRHITASVLSRSAFLAASDGITESDGVPNEHDGFLPFDDTTRFQTIEVDADGAAIKAVAFAEQVAVQVGKTSDNPGQPAAVPALRSFGLSVAERNRAVYMLYRFKSKEALEQTASGTGGGDITVHAEDITRGLRIDVWDGRANRWFSLLRRVGRYEVGRDGDISTLAITDEGSISPAPTLGPAVTNPDLYLQETLALWSGWSLAAPRPGIPISPDGTVAAGGQVTGNPADTNIALSASFTAEPGTLPPLRYGVEYRFRARLVDLAGNDVGFGDEGSLDGSHASPPVRYQRFEPIVAPVVLPREPRTAGETVERLVIRSDFDAASRAGSERHLAPPRTSQLMAEQHGMFDSATGMTAGAYADIAARDRFTFETSPQGDADPSDPTQRYFDTDVLDIAYLADPLALGVIFTGLPGTDPDQEFPVSFVTPGAPWPARRPLRFRLIEGNGAPTLTEVGGAQVLTVQQPKAAVATVNFASMIPAGDDTLNLLGIWGWLKEKHPGADGRPILASRHWMVTPNRSFTLVHAVRRPLVAPSFTQFRLERFMSSVLPRQGTSAAFTAEVAFNSASTQQLDVIAEWIDPVDVGVPEAQLVAPPLTPNKDSAGSAVDASGDPITVTRRARAFGIAINAQAPDLASEPNLEHEIGDLKHHEIDYSVIATTKFQEYFTEEFSTTASTAPIVVDPAGFAPGSVKVSRGTGVDLVILSAGADYRTDDVAGTIVCNDTENLPNGTIIEVTYVAAPTTRQGPTTRVSIPASAPPATPEVLYVLPTFGWSASVTGKVRKQSTRTGNGLRVYLGRPWWTSGIGEQLGVVLWDPPVGPSGAVPLTVSPDELGRYVTQYADDPISAGLTRITRAPRLTDFPRATASMGALSPQEMPGQAVTVAGHPVAFDTERKLWYCDIEINVGLAYFPFIRLGLVRFQPDANPGCHLSNTVLADFIQLTPDRKATVTFDPARPLDLGVTVTGVTYTQTRDYKGALRIGSTEVRVTVERQDVPAAGDAGWAAIDGLTSLRLDPSTIVLSPSTTWSGHITLASSRLSVPQRLVIEEFELRDTGPQDPARTDADGNLPDGRRLVYTDIIRL